MNKATMRSAVLGIFCTVFVCTAGIGRADVTIVRSTSVTGVGAMALGNQSGSTTTIISGDKSRTQTDVKMQSKLVGFLARGAVGPTAEIVLLDDDKLYHLNISKKEYTETSFEQIKAQMQKATDQMSQSQDSNNKQPAAVDQSKCVWLPAKVSVAKTGEKAAYGGYDSERVIITASQPCQDKDTGSICEVALVLDQWLAPGFTESPEIRKYYTAYAAKMGMDAAGLQDMTQKAKGMFSQYQGIWTEVAAKMQGMKGYAVKSGFTLALGGTQCKDPKAQQAQSNQPDSTPTPTSPSDLAGAVAGKLGGLFHKKQDDADSSAAQPVSAVTPVPLPPGDVALMTVTSQLVSISTDSVGADAFVVPADFKKQELKNQ